MDKHVAENVVVEPMDDGCFVLRLARPPVNALNPALLGEITAALVELERDDAVRAVILTGSDKVLSAGMDLKELVAFSDAEHRATVDGLNKCYAAAYEFSKPMIVAATGHAIAGGLFFVLAGDYRIVSDKALFGLTEVRVAVNFPVVANAIACHELGASGARRIMLSGQNVSAGRALEMGFVDEVMDASAVMDRALIKAGEYAAIPPLAYAAVKAQIRGSVIASYQGVEDPALDNWFTDETRAAATAVLAAASLSHRPGK